MTEAAVRLEGVEFGYRKGQTVLEDVELEITPGITCVLGETGTGKTTLLRLVLGELTPREGSIERNWDSHAFVTQQADLFEGKPLDWHIDLVTGVSGVSEEDAGKWLERMELDEYREKPPGEMSGGQLKRAAVLTGILRRPELLLLDEPSGDQDPETARVIFETVHRFAEETGAAVAATTHDWLNVRRFADRSFLIRGTDLSPLGEERLKDMVSGAYPVETV